jgi:superfamily II helicase
MSADTAGGQASQQMLQMLSQAGVHKDHQEAVRDLISQDFLLSNLDNTDVRYIRLLAENIALYASCQAPPTESGLQSEVAAGLMADPDAADLEPMSPSDKDRIESVMLAFFSRVCRSRDGWQQEKLSEQIVTNRMEKLEEDDEAEGVLGRLFA